MNFSFYKSEEYKKKQSEIAKANWNKGKYTSLIKPLVKRGCKNPNCANSFLVKSFDPKKFCSKRCAVTFNNTRRKHSLLTRQKISLALKGNQNPLKGIPKVRVKITCSCCQKEFKVTPYLKNKRKFCSNTCAMKVIGGQTTSAKASKGKPGIRTDIDSDICFYSTWEANVARVFNLLGITWQYAPKIFDLGDHTYRPDFYLPNDDMYVEVKNFMNTYSLTRDKLFREKYPNIKLEILSRKEYDEIETHYKPLIDSWER